MAFLLAELDQEQVATVALRPSTFNLSDITYQAEGFGCETAPARHPRYRIS